MDRLKHSYYQYKGRMLPIYVLRHGPEAERLGEAVTNHDAVVMEEAFQYGLFEMDFIFSVVAWGKRRFCLMQEVKKDVIK